MLGCNAGQRGEVMRKLLLMAAIFAGALGVSAAQADTVGAGGGAGTGLFAAGRPGGGWRRRGCLGQTILGTIDQQESLLDRQRFPSSLQPRQELVRRFARNDRTP